MYNSMRCVGMVVMFLLIWFLPDLAQGQPPGGGEAGADSSAATPATGPAAEVPAGDPPGGEEKADEKIEKINTKLDSVLKKLEEKKILRFGFSVGLRYIVEDSGGISDASISFPDTLLVLDEFDRSSLVISGVIAVFPFAKSSGKVANLGFLANIDLAEFSDEEVTTIFNREIEGGMGVLWSFGEGFSLGLTFEKLLSRRPRDHILGMVGQKIYDSNGKVVTQLDKEDSNLFRNDSLNALSLKYVYHF
jgi:hypothetical protein